MTNAARHGGGRAHVLVRYGDSTVDLTVTNPRPAGRSTRAGGRHGLIGMRERAALVGGRLRAGEAGDEFRLRATIPYAGRLP